MKRSWYCSFVVLVSMLFSQAGWALAEPGLRKEDADMVQTKKFGTIEVLYGVVSYRPENPFFCKVRGTESERSAHVDAEKFCKKFWQLVESIECGSNERCSVNKINNAFRLIEKSNYRENNYGN